MKKVLTIEEVKKRLEKERGDSEGYHFQFDQILEEKLAELDPEFAKEMRELYELSGESRWYA